MKQEYEGITNSMLQILLECRSVTQLIQKKPAFWFYSEPVPYSSYLHYLIL